MALVPWKISARLAAVSCFCILAVGGYPQRVFAGGFFLYELGTPDVSLASAGYAARAQDAATVFTNPAGMTRIEGSELLVGAQPIYGHQVFSPNGRSTKTGTDGGNALVPLPAESLFYVYSLTPDLKLGIGNCTYFGGILEYNLNWVGRYHLQGVTLLGNSTLLTGAYRINRWLSVGAGFNVMVGYLKEKVGVNNLLPRVPDGQLKLNGWWTAGLDGVIGILVEPTANTRLGVQYLTPVSLDFSGTPSFRGLGPGLSFPGFHPAVVRPASELVAGDREPAIALGPAE